MAGSRHVVIRKPLEIVFDMEEKGEMVFHFNPAEVRRPSCSWRKPRASRASFVENQPPCRRAFLQEELG